ncbi:Cof-type HAD-IIB family hydrolase [Sharpea azabuensis]|uniref:Cof subfamily of IIB subfamily of haloacid dehalogenase superfamily/HAD-superfamily hydrolase, subfamily IIB n=1 Tax=Sharpea azabuensis TaxID=322505 RepID=A0A1H6YBA8_9FIRM|nr:Cof-type HAD-IIB family hydrolase [Sharpea azabuensis]SEJ37746.1 hypothetical protein SAMN04487834_11351 [Sharpea azabuensis]
MDIKIIFFDIDGTLKSFHNDGLTPGVIQALRQVQQRGIKIFIATGRAPYMMPHFDGVNFDGCLCFNGGYSYTKERVLYHNALDKQDIEQLIHNAKIMGEDVLVAGVKEMSATGLNKALEDYMSFAKLKITNYGDKHLQNVLDHDVYQLMVGTKEEQDAELLQGIKNLKVTRWWDCACDIVDKDCSKSQGISHVLEAYGYDRENVMAFGDGGNDMDMLAYAGMGVAMGNAKEKVKACANYVTDSVDDDGVVTALKHFHII